MEKYQTQITAAIKSLKLADHFVYVTLPVIHEQRLLLKIFDEIHTAIIHTIEAVLHYETLYRRIRDYDSLTNKLEAFQKCAKNYNISLQQIDQINQIIVVHNARTKSAMEFVRKEKVVIMSDNLTTKTLDARTIKKQLLLAKELVVAVNKKINRTTLS